MSQTGTVAPKERINIVYRQAGEGSAEVELPLKILAIGNYRAKADPLPLEERKPIDLNKDNFQAVMKEQELDLDLVVPDRITASSERRECAELTLSFRFSSLRDFTPEGILEQSPPLQALRDLRNALSALKGPLGNIPEFRKRLAQIIQDPITRRQLLCELQGQSEAIDCPALSQSEEQQLEEKQR